MSHSPLSRAFSPQEFCSGVVVMLPACVALVPFGMVTGIGAAAAGCDVWAALGLSAVVFSGAAQVLATQLFAAGAPAGVIVLTCLVAGLRFMLYSAAMAPYLRPLSRRWQQGLAFLLTDQVFAASIRQFDTGRDPGAAASHFLGGGGALWVSWQITNVVGFLAGASIPAGWSLDFAVPLCFLALLAPVLRSGPHLVAALVAGIAVLLLAALPLKLNLIVAGLAGIGAGVVAESMAGRWTRR
ncbi:MAG: AzlC family ABC transporter permease [Casimicrobiaceae bacterium]